MKRARSRDPGAAASASWNQGCWSEKWFGTMSSKIRRPRSWASAIIASASATVPNNGSIARSSATSYPPSFIGDGYQGVIQTASMPRAAR